MWNKFLIYSSFLKIDVLDELQSWILISIYQPYFEGDVFRHFSQAKGSFNHNLKNSKNLSTNLKRESTKLVIESFFSIKLKI